MKNTTQKQMNFYTILDICNHCSNQLNQKYSDTTTNPLCKTCLNKKVSCFKCGKEELISDVVFDSDYESLCYDCYADINYDYIYQTDFREDY